MLKGKYNIVTDGQWGSCGKGAVTTALAYRHRPEIISTTNMSNAGHTAVNVDGEKFVAKALPSASVLHKWYPEYSPQIVVGPSSAFDMDQLLHEAEHCGVHDKLVVHERAGVITPQHKESENDLVSGTKHIASTMQGCGAFLADKIMRRSDLQLARDYEQLKRYVDPNQYMPWNLCQAMANGDTILHEGSQGFSLDINHGSHYPHCTSRGTTAPQNLADMGIGHQYIGDIYLVIRPYPIRVGNVVEDGQTVGYSGGCYDDHKEISWAQVAEEAGAPPEVMAGELTTVTKRLRRVFTFSQTQFKRAIMVNGATKIALNFANYIDWSCYGATSYDRLSDKIKTFIELLEDTALLPVTMIGTGPQLNHVIWID